MVRLAVTAVLAFALTATAGIADSHGSALSGLHARQEAPEPSAGEDLSPLSPETQGKIEELEKTFDDNQIKLKDKAQKQGEDLDETNRELDKSLRTEQEAIATLTKASQRMSRPMSETGPQLPAKARKQPGHDDGGEIPLIK